MQWQGAMWGSSHSWFNSFATKILSKKKIKKKKIFLPPRVRRKTKTKTMWLCEEATAGKGTSKDLSGPKAVCCSLPPGVPVDSVSEELPTLARSRNKSVVPACWTVSWEPTGKCTTHLPIHHRRRCPGRRGPSGFLRWRWWVVAPAPPVASVDGLGGSLPVYFLFWWQREG